MRRGGSSGRREGHRCRTAWGLGLKGIPLVGEAGGSWEVRDFAGVGTGWGFLSSVHELIPGSVVLCGRFFWSPPCWSPNVTSPFPVWAGWSRSGAGVGQLGQTLAPPLQALKLHSSLEPHCHLWALDLPLCGTPPLQDVPELL